MPIWITSIAVIMSVLWLVILILAIAYWMCMALMGFMWVSSGSDKESDEKEKKD